LSSCKGNSRALPVAGLHHMAKANAGEFPSPLQRGAPTKTPDMHTNVNKLYTIYNVLQYLKIEDTSALSH